MIRCKQDKNNSDRGYLMTVNSENLMVEEDLHVRKCFFSLFSLPPDNPQNSLIYAPRGFLSLTFLWFETVSDISRTWRTEEKSFGIFTSYLSPGQLCVDSNYPLIAT